MRSSLQLTDTAFTTESKRKGLVFKGFLQYLHDIRRFYGIASFSISSVSLSLFIPFSLTRSLSFSLSLSLITTIGILSSDKGGSVHCAYIRIQYIYIYIYYYLCMYTIYTKCVPACSRVYVSLRVSGVQSMEAAEAPLSLYFRK